ncbi:MAG: hypothetical protein RIS28_1440, partial [Bacteroidota bacterium]
MAFCGVARQCSKYEQCGFDDAHVRCF